MTTNNNHNFDNLLSHFKLGKISGNNIQAFCPAHQDKKPSMTITLSDDKALIFCHAGCDIDDILKAANLTFADLFLDGNKPSNIYQYRDINGNLVYEKLKFKKPDGSKTFYQRQINNDKITDNLKDINRVPYNYPNLVKAINKDDIILYVEGEKDANTGKVLGYTATTMGSASDWKPEYAKYYKNANLILIPDKDKAGINLTQKMIDDLKPVTKSLKSIVLPDGKDLTEWVEAGNSNLKDLIDKADDLTPFAGLADPTVTTVLNGYEFNWTSISVTVRIERLTDDLEGLITVIDKNKKITVHKSKINLLAPKTLSELANKLTKYYKCDWNTMLSQITIACNNIVQSVGECENIDAEPPTMSVQYLIEPILPLGMPTTIFTSGGIGKSIIADYLAVIAQYGLMEYTIEDETITLRESVGLCPIGQYNVLYLDWEADKDTHKRYITAIKRGMGITEQRNIRYLHLDHPLAQVASEVRTMIAKYEIDFVIIDSQMAATASGTRGLTEAQVASEYYNIINSFGVTTLTLDHITKQGMNGDDNNVAPYGSVVKYNRSRSQFELQLGEEFINADEKKYALVHKKFNLGRKLKPMGICANFENSEDGHTLVSIQFSGFEVASEPQFVKTLTKVQQIEQAIKANNNMPMTVKEIAEVTGITETIVRTTCSRNFQKVDKKWGLKEKPDDNHNRNKSLL